MARMGISTEILGISVCSSFRSSRPGQNLGSQQTSFIFMEVFIGKFTTHPERPRSFCVDLPAPQQAIFHRRWLCIFGHSGHGRGLAEGRSHWIHAQEKGFEVGQETTSVIIAKTFGFSWFSHTFQSHVVFHWIINSFSEASHGVELMAEQESSQPGFQSQLAGTWGCALRVEVLVGGHTQYANIKIWMWWMKIGTTHHSKVRTWE